MMAELMDGDAVIAIYSVFPLISARLRSLDGTVLNDLNLVGMQLIFTRIHGVRGLDASRFVMTE